MGLLNRFSDVINSNFNAALDQAEDPAKMVKLINRETKETLGDARSASAHYLAEKKQLQKRIQWARKESRGWLDKAEVAITKNRDDLAKLALLEKAHHDEAILSMDAGLVHIDDAMSKLSHDTLRLEDKLKHALVRQKALIVRGQTAKSRIRVKRQLHDVSCDEVLSCFEEYECKLDGIEGLVESYGPASQTLSQEIDKLQSDELLGQELHALKSRISTEKVRAPHQESHQA